jgi:hypothetical protein
MSILYKAGSLIFFGLHRLAILQISLYGGLVGPRGSIEGSGVRFPLSFSVGAVGPTF